MGRDAPASSTAAPIRTCITAGAYRQLLPPNRSLELAVNLTRSTPGGPFPAASSEVGRYDTVGGPRHQQRHQPRRRYRRRTSHPGHPHRNPGRRRGLVPSCQGTRHVGRSHSTATLTAEVATEKVSRIGAEAAKLMHDPAEIDRILADGSARARVIAAPVMAKVKDIVGFIRS